MMLVYTLYLSIFLYSSLIRCTWTLHRPERVVVAGASTGVGNLVFRKLLSRTSFYPIGLVRDKNGFQSLKKLNPNIQKDQVKICDITVKDSLVGVFDGAKKAVICTSAVPIPKTMYKIKSFFRWLVAKDRPPRPQEMYYRKNERPYEVDYLGQINLIDEAVKAGVDHVILLGSMGGKTLFPSVNTSKY